MFTGRCPRFGETERAYFVQGLRYVDHLTVVRRMIDVKTLPALWIDGTDV